MSKIVQSNHLANQVKKVASFGKYRKVRILLNSNPCRVTPCEITVEHPLISLLDFASICSLGMLNYEIQEERDKLKVLLRPRTYCRVGISILQV